MTDRAAYHRDQHANPILEAWLASAYQAGLEAFDALEQPSAEDHCWVGQCLFCLDRPIEGFERSVQARAMGFEDAGAIGATILRFTGELDRAERLLEGLERSRLSDFGRAVEARERGMIAFARGARREAVAQLERAWELASTDPVGAAQLAHFSAMLALALAKVGRDGLAARHLERALERAKPHQRAPLLLMRSLCRLHAGDLSGARIDLDDLDGLEQLGSVTLEHRRYARGLVLRAMGLGAEAAGQLLEAASLARASGDAETEFHAEVMAGAISTDEGSASMARAHLHRASGLVQTDQERALLGLRQGALLARLNDPSAVGTLETALEMLRGLELGREVGLAHLHLAEAHLRAGRDREGFEQLVRATDARHALGGAALAAELPTLPAAFETLAATQRGTYVHVLLEDWRALERGGPGHVHLTTLGGYEVSLDGRAQRLESGVARGVETLAFLLHYGRATLEQVQANVFGDVPPARARNHFHVIRLALARCVPQLFVPYDPASRSYEVSHSGLRLSWDAREVERAVKLGGELGVQRALALYTGPFLPRSSSDWALELRSDLEFSVTRAGLEALEELFKLARFEACSSLAERLLEVNPLDIGVNVLLVRSVEQLRGALAAREVLAFRWAVFEREVGEVPEDLRSLQNAAWGRAN